MSRTVGAALRLPTDPTVTWPIDDSHIRVTHDLAIAESSSGARDLFHLAACPRYGADELLSVDRALVAAFASGI